jgi:dTDP-4-amino-4,6-dideoxygalactose transaminase
MKLKILSDYKEPFDAILDFEKMLSEYTGAPYVVLTDCCTHAIELCFRYKLSINEIKSITIPNRTYLSVPMVFHKLNIPYNTIDTEWNGEYNFGFTNIWDSARKLINGMYKNGQMQCLSFGLTKPLEIGRGGAILLDDVGTYKWLKMASYDGRDLSCLPWESQQNFNIGYHYMIRPEECIDGMNEMITNNISHSYTHKYPNINNITIN